MEFQKCDVNEKEKEKKERKNEQRKTNKVVKVIKKLQVGRWSLPLAPPGKPKSIILQ